MTVRSSEQFGPRPVQQSSTRASGTSDAATGFPVVAVVSTAGASETLPRVLSPLPSTFPAAVIAMHATPLGVDRDQVQALAHRINLPVSLARTGSALIPGRVLLVPANRQLLFGADRRVRLVDVFSVPPDRPPEGQLPSADLLLYTLAVAYGPRAIAVLLSGPGHPGALGAQAVHAYGGRTLVRGRPATGASTRTVASTDHRPSAPLTLDAIAPALTRLCGPSGQRPRG